MFLASVDPDPTEWIAPIISASGAAVAALVVGVFAIYNRRRGAIETKAPDVNEIWAREERQNRELDAERRLRRRMETVVGDLWHAFTGYARRVQAGGTTELTPGERHAIDLGSDIGTTTPTKETP